MNTVHLLVALGLALLPEEKAPNPTWTVLAPATITAEGDATFETLPDGSILVSGPSADKECFTEVSPITGFRLEVLPDESLPHRGPGRAGNGNFVLSELGVEARSKHAQKDFPVPLVRPTADYSQDTQDVSGLCDGLQNTGWSIYPQVGTTHVAVVETSRDLAHKTGTWLRFSLRFAYGSQHALGRFRLAVTAAPRPLRAPGSAEEEAWHEVQDRIASTIDEAVLYLLDSQELDGSWSFEAVAYRTGQTALAVYALQKAGLPRGHPSVLRGVEFLRANASHKTYAIACHIIALATYGDPKDAARIQEMVDELISWQVQGGFAYPDGARDMSNTQYAALALRMAAKAGFKVPQPVWNRLADFALLHKEEKRNPYAAAGFSYHPGSGPSLSMTAAGVGILAIIDEQHHKKRGDVKEGIEQGLRWIDEHWDVRNNVKPNEGHQNRYLQYWLYGLERVGGLLGRSRIGEHDWYREGARFLVDTQNGDGSWSAPGWGEGQPNTCFALLFLSRATGATTGSRGEARAAAYGGEDPTADVSLCASGDSPLAIWISAFGERALAAYTWPEETSPRVAKVEYWYAADRAVDEPLLLAAIEGDAARPCGGERFAVQYVFPRTGTYQVWADVRVADPAAASAEPALLRSAALEVRITAAPDPMLVRYAGDAARNLLTQTRVLCRASSELGDDRAAHLAADNLLSRGWVSADNDPQPSLVLDLERPVRADTLLLSHCATTDMTRDRRVKRVRVEVNRKQTFEFEMDGDAARKTAFRFPKPTQVHRLMLLVLETTEGNAEKRGVGFAEVELQLQGGD
ncbi:MAG: terpene cyclase/mutase family protein [Planctomycetes bacterium]|nr:terpene cyclase/mutase family protein [Planctomycetota bacterium]